MRIRKPITPHAPSHTKSPLRGPTFFSVTTPGSRVGLTAHRRSAPESSEILLQVHALVHIRHLIAVAVEHQRVPLKEFANTPLLGLAPARMVNIRIHVGVKA